VTPEEGMVLESRHLTRFLIGKWVTVLITDVDLVYIGLILLYPLGVGR